MILDYLQGFTTNKFTQRVENICLHIETTYKENPERSNKIIARKLICLSASKGTQGMEFMTF